MLLSVGGLTIDMGPSLTLTRQAVSDGGENGIYIHESEKDALFEGDLSVSVQDGGLRCILTIHIEDYLKGVVAYEMSDSFPLEALKAQAVAARTYAMGRKWVSATRDYDVVDTTQDQVYKGLDADYTNVIAAVEATRGVVGTYNRRLCHVLLHRQQRRADGAGHRHLGRRGRLRLSGHGG